MLSLDEKHLKELSDLIKCQESDLTIISREGFSFQTWKLLISLHSSTFAELLGTQETSRDITSVSIDAGKDDVQVLLEAIHYDFDIDSDAMAGNEAAILLEIADIRSICEIKKKNHEDLVLKKKKDILTDEDDNCLFNETPDKYDANNLDHKQTLHKTSKKKIIEKKNECSICSKTFQRPWKLRMHMANVHLHQEADIKSFETRCDRCKQSFQSWKDLNTHLYEAHIDQAINCQECDKIFFSQKGWIRHMKKHESTPMKQAK